MPDLQDLVKLLVDILELVLDHRLGKNILLAEHLGGLLAQQVLVALDLFGHQLQHLPVDLLGRDMAAKAVIVDHVHRLAADDAVPTGFPYSSTIKPANKGCFGMILFSHKNIRGSIEL